MRAGVWRTPRFSRSSEVCAIWRSRSLTRAWCTRSSVMVSARAFAEHAPLAMMPPHGPRNAKALRATGGLLRRNGGLDRLPLGGDPAAIDFEKNLKLVGEVHIGGAGRVPVARAMRLESVPKPTLL